MDWEPVLSRRHNDWVRIVKGYQDGNGGGASGFTIMSVRRQAPAIVGDRNLRRIVLGFAVAVSAILVSPGLGASAREPATHACSWVSKAALNDAGNWLWPDEAAGYVLGVFAVPPGGRVELKGKFPHARYLSFQSFDLATRAFDLVQDLQIRPDPGSTNPFTLHANRTATRRSYTLRIVDGRVPSSNRPPNTLYTQSQSGSPAAPGIAVVLLRSYLPDTGRDATGAVGWPEVSTVTSNGIRRPTPSCPAIQLPSVVTPILRNLQAPGAVPDLGLSGYSLPRWFRAWDSYPEMILNTLRSPLTDVLPLGTIGAAMPGTSIGNLSTGYLLSVYSQSHGRVLLLTGRAPTFPATHRGEPRMVGGQVRYWSMCSYTDATQYVGCVYDEQVPLDAHGNFRIVVSPAADRPTNARPACGLTWLPATPRASLILRNILAAPTFKHAIKSITRRGDEEPVMAAYYPRGHYVTAADIEALGCPARPAAPAPR